MKSHLVLIRKLLFDETLHDLECMQPAYLITLAAARLVISDHIPPCSQLLRLPSSVLATQAQNFDASIVRLIVNGLFNKGPQAETVQSLPVTIFSTSTSQLRPNFAREDQCWCGAKLRRLKSQRDCRHPCILLEGRAF